MSRPWLGHKRWSSAHRSHASVKDSPSACLNVVIFVRKCWVLDGGKYLPRNNFSISSQVSMWSRLTVRSHVLALSRRDRWKHLSLRLSNSSPSLANVPQIGRASCRERG